MTDTPQPREAGEGAVLLQLAAVIDATVNARAIAIADAVRRRGVPGVRDVVSTFHSVAVYFDPLRTNAGEVSAALHEATMVAPITAAGRQHQIPVSYGGEDGPDLEVVAAHAGLTAIQAIERHAGLAYRVFMLGFQPGFAYMGLVDPVIAMPRRSSPRLAVPRGSVGIAGRQTGVYPARSPGGWQIIGRALVPVFDSGQSPPSRFAPGDTVVFVPTRADGRAADATITSPADADTCLTVLRPGLLTTVQDAGAWGEQGIGAPISGAMDTLSHAIANLSVGNDRAAGALEVTIAGPELRVERESTIAVAGADLSPTLDGTRIELQKPTFCRAGSLLKFGDRRNGARAYVAVSGGLRVERAYARQPVGAGQPLAAGTSRRGPVRTFTTVVPLPAGGARLRVMPGPQRDQVPAACFDTLCARRFTVSPQSNRIGYRLSGQTLPPGTGEMISDATFPGAIQVPPSGEPILLLADRQTTGGYPQVAIVIAADLRIAGQLAPGDWIEFVPCSREDALTALAAQERWLHAS